MNQNPSDYSGTSVGARDVLGVLLRRLWVIVIIMAVALGTAAYVSAHTPKRWKATAQLLQVQRAAAFVQTTQAAYSAPIVESTDTQIAMLQSYAMALRTIQHLKNDALAKGRSTDTIDLAPEDLQKVMTVSTPKETNLLIIETEADGRERAIELANAACSAFVQWKRELSEQNIQATTSNLETRVNRARAQMVEAEHRELAFKQQHHLADVPLQQKAAVEQYMTRNAEVDTLKQELYPEEARLDELGKRLKLSNDAIKTSSGIRDDSLVMSLQTQLNNLEMERAAMAQKYTTEYPGMLTDQDAKIQDVKDRLAKAIQSTVDNKRPSLQAQGTLLQDYTEAAILVRFTSAKLRAAVAVRDQLKRDMGSLPQAGMEYAQLERNAELARTLYTDLQGALNSVRIDKDMASGDVQIAQYAFAPELPFRPNRLRDLLFGAAIGLFLSLVAVLTLEQADRRVRRVEDVRRLAPGPIIGAIPKMSRWQMRRMLRGETPPETLEAYNLTRANLSIHLRQAMREHPWGSQVILITSAVPGEGKSVTASQMARSIARTGARVILVDADMRRPTQNALFNTAEPHGLADILSGAMTLEETLVASDIPHLSILHSGTPECNPTDLISQPTMERVIEGLRAEADVIVVDAPACAVVADALLLAPYADCIFYVVGANQVDEEIVRETAAALHAAQPKSMVFLVNQAPKERGRSSSYYYYASQDIKRLPTGAPTGGESS